MPRLTRRRFLQSAAAATGAVAFAGCGGVPAHEEQIESRVRLPEEVVAGYETWYATTCGACPAGCGVLIRVVDGRARKAEGNPEHPVNQGKLCVRGQAIIQEQYHPDRIRGPLLRTGERGSGSFRPISWGDALDRLGAAVSQVGNGVALVTPPLRGHQALVARRFSQALGARWLACEPLAELPLREAARRLWGRDGLPAFDLRNARYVVSFGADFLSSWVSPVSYGIQYGVFRQGEYGLNTFAPQARPRGYLVYVGPHFSPTAAAADEWLPAQPGTEGAVALAMAQVMSGDPALSSFSPDQAGRLAGIEPERIRRIAREFAANEPALAIGGGQAGAHTNGTAALSAVLALNRAAPAFGSTIEGLEPKRANSLAEWQQFAASLYRGDIDTLLVHGVDAVHGLPGTLGARDALLKARFVASFGSFMDETTRLADLILPSHLQLEDWGDDVPESLAGPAAVGFQQPVVSPLYDTRGVWDVLLGLAQRLGRPLPWASFKEVVREGARSLQGLNRGSVRDPDLERFWIGVRQRGVWRDDQNLPAATAGSPSWAEIAGAWQPPRFAGGEREFPLHLVVFAHNSLGAGEGAHLPWLQAAPDPLTSVVWQTWVEVNPSRARELGLREGDIVRVESAAGAVEAPVYLHPAAPPDVVAVPLGQGQASYGRWASGRGANAMALLAPLMDEATGALAYAATRVRLVKTGRRMPLPKFEGTVPAYQLPDHPVIELEHQKGP